MTINGKKQNIRRKDFIKFAQTAGIQEKSVEKMIDKIDCVVKKTFNYYGYPFYKNERIVFNNNEGKIQNKTGKYTLKLNESVTAYDLYVSWKEKKLV